MFITNISDEPLKILSATSSKRNISVKYETLEEGTKYRIDIILTSPSEGGRRDVGTVTVLTDRKINPEIKLKVNQFIVTNQRLRRPGPGSKKLGK